MEDTNKNYMTSFMQEQRARTYSETGTRPVTPQKQQESSSSSPPSSQKSPRQQDSVQQVSPTPRSQSTPNLGSGGSGSESGGSSHLVPRLNLREQRNTLSLSSSSVLRQQQTPPQSPPQQQSPRKARSPRHTISAGTGVQATEESSTEVLKSPRSISVGAGGWPTSLRADSPRANDTDSSGGGGNNNGTRSPPLHQQQQPLLQQRSKSPPPRTAIVIGAPQQPQPIVPLVRRETELAIGDDHSTTSREASVVPLDVTSGATISAQPLQRKGKQDIRRDYDVTYASTSSTSEQEEEEEDDDDDKALSSKKLVADRSEQVVLQKLMDCMKELKSLKHNYYEDNELAQQIENQQLLIDGITQELMEIKQRTSSCCCVLF